MKSVAFTLGVMGTLNKVTVSQAGYRLSHSLS